MDMLYVANDISKAICRIVISCNTILVGDENCSWDIKKQKENRMSVIIWSKDKLSTVIWPLGFFLTINKGYKKKKWKLPRTNVTNPQKLWG